MSTDNYKVVLTGSIVEGFQRENVIHDAAKLFKCSEERAAKFFNDTSTPLKKAMNQITAEKYRNRLLQAGIACTIKEPELSLELNSSTNAVSSVHGSPKVINTLDAGLSLEPMTETKTELEEKGSDSKSSKVPTGFSCPKCHTPQTKGEECIKCGIIFSKYQAPEPVISEMSEEDEDLDHWSEIELFVGENIEAYQHKFRALYNNDGKYQLQWHWPAFLIPVPWLIYRKMYIWALAYFIIMLVVPTVLLIPIVLLPGFVGNFLYYRHTIQQLEKIESTADQRRFDIANTGQTNSILITIILSILLSMIMSFFMYKFFFEAMIKDSLKTTSDDMQILSENDDEFTSATKLQMIMIKNAIIMQKSLMEQSNTHYTMPTNMEEVLQSLDSSSSLVEDAWGNNMEFELNNNQMVFYSAGKDGEFNTSDDVRYIAVIE